MHKLTFWVLEVEQLKGTRGLERTLEIPDVAVDLASTRERCVREDTEVLRTLAITMRSAKPLEISLAMSIGLVSQEVPLRFDPSGRVISISCLGWAFACRVSLLRYCS